MASKGIWADFGAGGTGWLPNTTHPIMNCFQSRKKRKYFQAASFQNRCFTGGTAQDRLGESHLSEYLECYLAFLMLFGFQLCYFGFLMLFWFSHAILVFSCYFRFSHAILGFLMLFET